MTGSIQFFNDRGFGFIKTESGESFFVHVKHVEDCRILPAGTRVEFDLTPSHAPGKRPEAKNVKVLAEVANAKAEAR